MMLKTVFQSIFLLVLFKEDALTSDLLVTSLDFSNHTVTNNTSNLKVTSLDLNNHTAQANRSVTSLLPTGTTTLIRVADDSSRSEIYKMNNGLMLLHAQRDHLGPEAKKSILLQKEASSSINYHVRSRTKGNDSANSFAEHEKKLEAKLGNLPQVHQKKRSAVVPEVNGYRKHSNTARLNKKRTYRHGKRDKWRSVIQGENKGGDVLKRSTYPAKNSKHKRDTYRGVLDILKDESIIDDIVTPTSSFKLLKKHDEKHGRLRRALSMMGSLSEDDPLFDADQPEETLKREYEKRAQRIRKQHKKLGNLYNRGIEEDVQAIPPISDIKQSFDPIKPLEPYPRFPEFHSAIGHYPRFGVPDLKLMNYPRFGEPKMDDYENIPGIPRIRPLSRGDEVTGDRRGFQPREDFYDEELDDSIEHIQRAKEMTAPTPIPSLTDIPSITDIPTLKPIPAAPGKPASTSGGVNGKMPVMQTVDTKNGEETRISA